MDKFRIILYIYINLITIRGAYKKEAFIQLLNNYKYMSIIGVIFTPS